MGVDTRQLREIVERFEREARDADERLAVLERACDAADAERAARQEALERAAACEARAADVEGERKTLKTRILDAMAEDDDETASALKARRKALADEAEKALEEAGEHRAEAERHDTVNPHLFARVAYGGKRPELPYIPFFSEEMDKAMREVAAGLESRAHDLREKRTSPHWDEGLFFDMAGGGKTPTSGGTGASRTKPTAAPASTPTPTGRRRPPSTTPTTEEHRHAPPEP